MRIRMNLDRMRLTIPVPFICLLRPSVYKVVKRRVKELPALGGEEIRVVRRALRALSREMPGFRLVEVETSDGEQITITL